MNKVITIGQDNKDKELNTLQNEIVYSDINMIAQQLKNTKKPTWDDYYCYLVTEKHTYEEIYNIITEESNKEVSPEDKENLYLYYVQTGDYEEALKRWNETDKRRIALSYNIRAVQNSIDNIFKWNFGERIINPAFGSKLNTLLYEGITDYNQQAIYAEIKNALNTWEPRVILKGVNNSSTLEDKENNTIVLDIEYSIKGISDKIFKKQYIYNSYIN